MPKYTLSYYVAKVYFVWTRTRQIREPCWKLCSNFGKETEAIELLKTLRFQQCVHLDTYTALLKTLANVAHQQSVKKKFMKSLEKQTIPKRCSDGHIEYCFDIPAVSGFAKMPEIFQGLFQKLLSPGLLASPPGIFPPKFENMKIMLSSEKKKCFKMSFWKCRMLFC